MNDLKYAKHIAETILDQLGGPRFLFMTGAEVSYNINEKQQPYLRCALPTDLEIKQNINLVLITYDMGLDLYVLSFINTRLNAANKVIKSIFDVYAEDLIPLFEAETGLLCYM